MVLCPVNTCKMWVWYLHWVFTYYWTIVHLLSLVYDACWTKSIDFIPIILMFNICPLFKITCPRFIWSFKMKIYFSDKLKDLWQIWSGPFLWKPRRERNVVWCVYMWVWNVRTFSPELFFLISSRWPCYQFYQYPLKEKINCSFRD